MTQKYLFTGLGVLIIALGCSRKIQSSAESVSKQWQEVNSKDDSKPIARHEAAFVRVNSKMYLLGGRGIRPVSIYDALTQKWSLGAKPPIELHHFQPVVYQDNVYFIGALTGQYPAEVPVPVIYSYNTTTNSWATGDKIPTARLRGSTGNVIHDGIVYISCGITNGHIDGHQNKMDSYNIKTGEWKVLPDAPRARDHFQAVLAKDKIYVLGGRLSKAPKNTFAETIGAVDVFDIKKNKWETLKSPLPNERAGTMATLYKNQVLVIGGESIRQNPAHAEVDALNIKTNEWSVFPKLVTGRHGSGVVIYNNTLYIASGCGNRGGSPELTTMEKY
ncbi:kelch repeat-containing protein [Flavobacterium ovatum]|uniref:Kelch repeat-containing protein n=1 Tax=Flavobacterium ovatum TaxID=1928857 RepID=UPI00344B1685